MAENAPYIVLHGGFHKTATSHIQSILRRNSDYLFQSGRVSYAHHRDTRKQLTVPCQLNVYDKIGLNFEKVYTDDQLAETAQNFFSNLIRDNTKRVIISEENLAGHCGHCVKSGGLYRWRNKLISTFANQFPWQVNEVHLGIRNYADFFASAYVEFLRSTSRKNFVTDIQMRVAVLEKMPSWNKAIAAFQKSFPCAAIYVWKYEDFAKLDEKILSNLCGPEVDITKLQKPKASNVRPTASGRAVEELLQLIRLEGVDAALARRVEIQEIFPRGDKYGGYDPWTARERTHLTRIYERDLEDIRANPDITLLEAEGAEIFDVVVESGG